MMTRFIYPQVIYLLQKFLFTLITLYLISSFIKTLGINIDNDQFSLRHALRVLNQ